MKELFEPFLRAFGIEDDEEVSPAQQDRLALAAEVTSEHGSIYFDDNTNPLNERGQEALTNPLRVPSGSIAVPDMNSNSPKNSWVKRRGEAVWLDESGFYFPKGDMRFLIRGGYNPDQHESIEAFCFSQTREITMFNKTFRVHNIFAARLLSANANLEAAGIHHTVDWAKGYNFRAMIDAGRISNHAFGLAVDFDPSVNVMEAFPDGNEDEVANYPEGLVEIMRDSHIRTYQEWTGARNRIDLMHFDLNTDAMGRIPMSFEAQEHSHS